MRDEIGEMRRWLCQARAKDKDRGGDKEFANALTYAAP